MILRSLGRRKLETAVIVLLVAVAVTGIASLSQSLDYAIHLGSLAWTREVGSVVISFAGPPVEEEVLSGLPVERAKQIETATAVGWSKNVAYSVLLVYNPDPDYPVSFRGYWRPSEYEALVYHPGTTVEVGGYVDIMEHRLWIKGSTRGVVTLGPAELVLLVDRSVVEEVGNATGSLTTSLHLVLSGGDPKEVAHTLESRISAERSVLDSIVVSEEDNPARGPLKGIGKAMGILTWSALAAGLLLIGATGVLDMERSSREVAILRSLGAGRAFISRLYGGPRLIAGTMGVALGLILSIPVSRFLVMMGTSGSATMQILMAEFPFSLSLSPMLSTGLLALLAVAAAALVPPAVLAGGEVVPALRGGRGPGRGPISGMVLRNLASRPWKPIALILVASVLLGTVASIGMVKAGYSDSIERLADAPFSAEAFVSGDRVLDAVKALGAGDAYLINWWGPELGGRRLVVAHRLGTGDYLWYPIVSGSLPGQGEVLVSERIAEELSISPGSYLSFGGRTYRVSGIAALPLNNGWSLVVGGGGLPGYEGMVLTTMEASEAKAVLLGAGIPAKVVEKDSLLEDMREAGSSLGAFLFIMNSATLATSILALAFLGILDFASRKHEMAILRALGVSNGTLSGLQALEFLVLLPAYLPAAAGIGFLLAEGMTKPLMEAFGYFAPSGTWSSALASLWALGAGILISLPFWLLFLRRTEFSLRTMEQ